MVHRSYCSTPLSHGIATRRFVLAALICGLALTSRAPAADTFYLQYRHWQPYDWPGATPAAREVTRSQRGVAWSRNIAGGAFGVSYDYQPLRIRTGAPAHNGHLHRLAAGGAWQQGLYRVQARASLAGTSNMFKDQDFHRKVINGRIAAFRALGEGSELSLGLGGDHRFGSFQWLPRVRWQHTNALGLWLVDLPVLAQWQSPGNRWTFTVSRVGDRWATLDKAREVESALYLREWRAEVTYRLGRGDGSWPEVVLGLGASVDTRVRYRDLNTGIRDLHLGETLLGSLTLSW